MTLPFHENPVYSHHIKGSWESWSEFLVAECLSTHQPTSDVATIFGTPRQQLVWAPGQGVRATTSSWRAPSAPRAPRGCGACGALATRLQPTRIREEMLESGGPLQRKLNFRLRTSCIIIKCPDQIVKSNQISVKFCLLHQSKYLSDTEQNYKNPQWFYVWVKGWDRPNKHL